MRLHIKVIPSRGSPSRKVGDSPLIRLIMPYNEYEQEVAEPLPGWEPRELPSKIVIKGRFCTLVPLDLEKHSQDLFEAFKLVGDGRTWTYLRLGPFSTSDEFKKGWEDLEKDATDIFFSIIDNDTNKPVGIFNLRRCDPYNGTIEEGYVTFSPLLQRTKMAMEANYLLASYVFDDLKYRRYEWQCVNFNKPSAKAAMRLGFKYEGTLRQNMVFRGRTRDTIWLSMIESEWDSCKKAFELWLQDTNFDSDGNQIQRLQDIRDSLV